MRSADSILLWMSRRVGALPARRVTWGLVLLFSGWVLLDVWVFQLTGGVAQSSYDAMVRARLVVAAPDPRIVIIDIDEASLSRMAPEFGRWPWPRDTLATILDHLERQRPAAIVWDMVFSDADRLSPGGDAAFNTAAQRSEHSHFSVVRLPKANDTVSELTHAALPGLWLGRARTPTASTVALIAPVLPGVANSRLGFNNGFVDADGVLRRYRYQEPLPDGSAIQSLPISVLGAMDTKALNTYKTRVEDNFYPQDELVSWRQSADIYPRIAFADVFAQAEGGEPKGSVLSFTNKVVIIGATAPSLHDIHPTPLSPLHAGVDTLATAVDNALNQRHVRELPRGWQAALAIALCVGLGLWVQFNSVASLAPALLVLPATLIAISYVSLNGLPIFVDLNLSAGLALVFLALLRVWSGLRRDYWCSPPPHTTQALGIWPWERSEAWLEGPLDRLIDAVEHHAPTCRVVVCDARIQWPATLRWPELARFAAVVGPHTALLASRHSLEPALRHLATRCGELVAIDSAADRSTLADSVFTVWSRFQSPEFKNT